jgi:tripartite-type tricarboxylate transporter receptor subunit TctC
MQLPRRQFLNLAVGAAALPAVSRVAWAQTYPTGPVRIVVGWGSGGVADILARLIAQWLSKRLGQPFIVENRPGGSGNVGAEAVVRAPPDGHTLLLCGSPDAFNATLYDKLKFNFISDITPIASIAGGPSVLVVHPSFPAKTVPELITHAKANPGKVDFATAGVGSVSHMAGERFKAMAEVNLVHVPYRSLAPALTDLIGGQVQVIFSSMPTAIEYIKAGRLRALAVTSAKRSEALPDLPTVADFLPGYEASGWYGVGAPKNTRAEIVERLNKEINAALADPQMKARLADLGNVPMPMTPTEFGRFIAEETERWGKVIRAANIKPE